MTDFFAFTLIALRAASGEADELIAPVELDELTVSAELRVYLEPVDVDLPLDVEIVEVVLRGLCAPGGD